MLSQIYEHDDFSVIVATSSGCSPSSPGNGGIRIKEYESDQLAEVEVIRLARVMALKHLFARTGMSGAKVVVNAKKDICKQQVMRTIGTEILGDGSLYLGCDMGTDEKDMDILSMHSKYVLASRGSKVDPNWATAESTFGCIQATLRGKLGSSTFLVEGVGKVGSHIARLLMKHGAKEVICKDLDEERERVHSFVNDLARTTKSFQGDFDSEASALAEVDVFVPCASCDTVTSKLLDLLKKCTVIAGPANAAVSNGQAMQTILDRKITLIPDYMTGTGAILIDVLEHAGKLLEVHPALAYAWVRSVSATRCTRVLERFREQILCRSKGISATTLAEYIESDDVLRVDAMTSFKDMESSMREECDVVIVGGGMAGCAAAYSLCVKEGYRNVVLLEQAPEAAPKGGSSAGDSRMYRRMYSDPFYSRMQEQALKGWAELQERTGEKLLHENGLLFYGADTEDTVEGSVKGAAKTMRELEIPHQELTAEQIEARWPNLKACEASTPEQPVTGVFEATAGYISSSAACRTMLCAAEKEGLRVHFGETLSSMHPTTSTTVECVCWTGRTFVAKKAVVLALGPWTGDLLQENFGLELDLTIWRIHYAHYCNKQGTSLPQAFNFRPAQGSDGGLYYCFPTGSEREDCPQGLKVGTDFVTKNTSRDVVKSMKEFDATPSEDVMRLMDAWVRENLKGIGERVKSYCAPYTMTTDQHYFIIDKVPAEYLSSARLPPFKDSPRSASNPNVVIFAGGNGRAFKFAPLIGDCLSALLIGKPAPMDISKFKMTKNMKDFSALAVSRGPGAPDSENHAHHEPVGKDGEGFYSAATLGCFNVIKNSQPLLMAAIQKILENKEGPLQLADFGTADAGTSLGVIYDLCKRIRQEQEGREIQVHYEDQTMNEWKSVFRHCLGEIEVKDASGKVLPSPFKELGNVFFTGIGQSFYAQNLPSNTISLGMSFTAMHWLSRDPHSMVGLSGKCHYSQLTEQEKASGWGAAHSRQAAEDWEVIMAQRIKELAPGGHFVCANFAHTDEGHFLGRSNVGVSMFDQFCVAWNELCKSGHISEQERDALSFPNYYRTSQECMRPFLPGGSLADAAEVVSVEVKRTPCPFREAYTRGEFQGSAEDYARWFVPTTKTWSNSTFMQALSPSRCNKEAVVEEFWKTYERQVAKFPEQHGMDYFHTYFVIRKF